MSDQRTEVTRADLLAALERASHLGFSAPSRAILQMLNDPHVVIRQSPNLIPTSRMQQIYSARADYRVASGGNADALADLVAVIDKARVDATWRIIAISSANDRGAVFIADDGATVGCLMHDANAEVD